MEVTALFYCLLSGPQSTSWRRSGRKNYFVLQVKQLIGFGRKPFFYGRFFVCTNCCWLHIGYLRADIKKCQAGESGSVKADWWKMITNALIAPCDMNCGVCLAYLQDKNRCIGRPASEEKPEYCRKCIIINCELLSQTDSKFCYECTKYSCKRLMVI